MFTLATENTRKCYQAPFPIFRTGPGNEVGHTVHCAGSASAERVEQGEVGGVTRRVTCTWQLLGLAVKGSWLTPDRPILGLAAWAGLENVTFTFQGFISAREGFLGSKWVFANQECWPLHEWAWLMSRVWKWSCVSFGVRAWTEMEIVCIKDMYRLKLISSEKDSGFWRVLINDTKV